MRGRLLFEKRHAEVTEIKLAGVAAALAIGTTASLSALAVDITGAGTTFPYAV